MAGLICEMSWFCLILSNLLSTENGFDPVRTDPPLPTSSPNFANDNNTQTSTKLKLQLFPIEEGTRRALEMVSLKRSYATEFHVE